MIKLSNSIPSVVPDGTNPVEMMIFLTQLKLVVEELVNKAKSVQTEVRTAHPTLTSEFDVEGEEVRSVVGAVIRSYQLVNGVLRYVALT